MAPRMRTADADWETVDAYDRLRVPPGQPHYTLRRLWLTKEEEEGYYLGFANEGIWPLCHIAHMRPVFRAGDWEHYQRVNEKFARTVLEEIESAENPFVLIQDYHFALLPRLIKSKRPDARVAIFWHIPWPNPEAFGICPWKQELLDGLLGADLVGFHIQGHCNNFLETVDQSLECRIERDRFTVDRNNHSTLVRPHPISVALPESVAEDGSGVTWEQNRTAILEQLGAETLFLGVGVDRLTTPRESWSVSAGLNVFSRSVRTIGSNSRLCNSGLLAARASNATRTLSLRWKRRPIVSTGVCKLSDGSRLFFSTGTTAIRKLNPITRQRIFVSSPRCTMA
jgi:trehalose-6-phosphate synthase